MLVVRVREAVKEALGADAKLEEVVRSFLGIRITTSVDVPVREIRIAVGADSDEKATVLVVSSGLLEVLEPFGGGLVALREESEDSVLTDVDSVRIVVPLKVVVLVVRHFVFLLHVNHRDFQRHFGIKLALKGKTYRKREG